MIVIHLDVLLMVAVLAILCYQKQISKMMKKRLCINCDNEVPNPGTCPLCGYVQTYTKK